MCCDNDCCCEGGLTDFVTAIFTFTYEFIGCAFLLLFIFFKAVLLITPDRRNIGEPIGIRLINAFKNRTKGKVQNQVAD